MFRQMCKRFFHNGGIIEDYRGKVKGILGKLLGKK
jgi:hypothetical protein